VLSPVCRYAATVVSLEDRGLYEACLVLFVAKRYDGHRGLRPHLEREAIALPWQNALGR
jgi:hypothetical protein